MFKHTNFLFFLFLLSFFFFPHKTEATYTHLFWERSISRALNDRDDFYEKVGIKHDEATFNMLWTPKGRAALKNQLELQVDPDSPWYHFLYGIVNSSISVSQAVQSFNSAMSNADNKPGVTWVLFYEFRQSKKKKVPTATLR